MLNDQQIGYIEARLHEAGVHSEGLRAELLDHICCAVETKMQQGAQFNQAVQYTFEAFGDKGLQNIQSKVTTNRQWKQIIPYVAIGLLLFISIAALYYHLSIPTQHPPSIAPIHSKFAISSPYGLRMHPVYGLEKMHQGIDIKVPHGTEVLATAQGEVILIESTAKDGLKLVIKHDDTYLTVYAQLSSVQVKEGQELQRGDIIGHSGSGNLSTGPHLHYEVIKNGKHVDPQQFLSPNTCCAP